MRRFLFISFVGVVLIFLLTCTVASATRYSFDEYWFPGDIGSQWIYQKNNERITVQLSYEDFDSFLCWTLRATPSTALFFGENQMAYSYSSDGFISLHKKGYASEDVFPWFFDAIYSPSERPFEWEATDGYTTGVAIWGEMSQSKDGLLTINYRKKTDQSVIFYTWQLREGVGPVKLQDHISGETITLESYKIFSLDGGPVRTGSYNYNVSPKGKLATTWGAVKK